VNKRSGLFIMLAVKTRAMVQMICLSNNLSEFVPLQNAEPPYTDGDSDVLEKDTVPRG
jgi:hypothetical protein